MWCRWKASSDSWWVPANTPGDCQLTLWQTVENDFVSPLPYKDHRQNGQIRNSSASALNFLRKLLKCSVSPVLQSGRGLPQRTLWSQQAPSGILISSLGMRYPSQTVNGKKNHQSSAVSQPDNQSPKKGKVFFRRECECCLGREAEEGQSKNGQCPEKRSKEDTAAWAELRRTLCRIEASKGRGLCPRLVWNIHSRQPRVPVPLRAPSGRERQHLAQAAEMPSAIGLAQWAQCLETGVNQRRGGWWMPWTAVWWLRPASGLGDVGVSPHSPTSMLWDLWDIT